MSKIFGKRQTGYRCPVCGRFEWEDDRFCSECFMLNPKRLGQPMSVTATIQKCSKAPLTVWGIAVAIAVVVIALGVYAWGSLFNEPLPPSIPSGPGQTQTPPPGSDTSKLNIEPEPNAIIPPAPAESVNNGNNNPPPENSRETIGPGTKPSTTDSTTEKSQPGLKDEEKDTSEEQKVTSTTVPESSDAGGATSDDQVERNNELGETPDDNETDSLNNNPRE